MRKNQTWEKELTQALFDEGNKITANPEMKKKIDNQLNACIAGETKRENRGMNKRILKRVAVSAAAACLLLTTGVFAAGKVTGYITSTEPDKKYTSFNEIDQAKKDAGFEFTALETFSNGFGMDEMRVSTTDKMDDEGNRVGKFKEWSATYENENGQSIDVIVSEVQPESEAEDYQESREIGGTSVGYKVDHYKFVPDDYETTAEDEANEAAGHYFISYGTDEIEEMDYQDISWEQNGIQYLIMTNCDSVSGEDMFEMATELLKAE